MRKVHQQQPKQATNGRVSLGGRVRRLWESSALHAFLFEPRLNHDIEAALIEVALYLNNQSLPDHIAAMWEEIDEWACYRHGYFRARRRARQLFELRYKLLLLLASGLVGCFLPEFLG